MDEGSLLAEALRPPHPNSNEYPDPHSHLPERNAVLLDVYLFFYRSFIQARHGHFPKADNPTVLHNTVALKQLSR